MQSMACSQAASVYKGDDMQPCSDAAETFVLSDFSADITEPLAKSTSSEQVDS